MRAANKIIRLAMAAGLLFLGACAQNSATSSLNTANLTAKPPQAAPIASTPARPGQTRVALLPSAALSAESQSLTEQMARMLILNGFHLVAAPGEVAADENLYFVIPEFDLNSGENGRNTIQVNWLVADASGDPLGKITQTRALDGNTGGDTWNRQATLAAAAAAEGVSQIIREQRDL
ncbi:MAG: hypothetical protein ACTSWM_01860 [Alphaproteobacteria bacterium]